MAVGGSMREADEPVFAALEEVLEAIRTLQRSLRESEDRTVANMARLRSGEQLADIVRQAPVSMARIDINEAIDRLIAARQVSRAVSFRRLTEDGMNRKEIASKWGFSQQVVSRILNHDSPSAGTGR
jgi:hypothetical protein